MPRIKGSRRARKQRRNQRAVVIPAQGSSGAGRLSAGPVPLSVPVGSPGRRRQQHLGRGPRGAMLQGWPRGSPWGECRPSGHSWGNKGQGWGAGMGLLGGWGALSLAPSLAPHLAPQASAATDVGAGPHHSAGAWIPAPPPPEPALRLKGPHGAADKGGNANTLLGPGIPTI